MYRPPRPQMPQPHMGWGQQRPPLNPQWRHPGGPRASFHGPRQRFHQPRQPFQPVNDNFWCETCDRGFPTEDILNKHKQQHQKCNIDGCQFIAHPKVITKHIQMQHSTGLYKKIANLKNPEEIAKWREERRKRYPTQSNIDKKAAELKEKIERGEKMGLNRGSRQREKPNFEQNKSGPGLKRRSDTRNENQLRPKARKNNNSDKNHNKTPKSKPEVQSDETHNYKLKPFAGILNMQMDNDEEIETGTNENDLIEDDDGEVKSSEIENTADNKSEPVVCGALSTLMCEYGSSDEEDSGERGQTDTKSATKPPSIDNMKKINIDGELAIHNNSSNSVNNSQMASDLKNVGRCADVNDSTKINVNIPQDKDPTDVSKVDIQTEKIEPKISTPLLICDTSQDNDQDQQPHTVAEKPSTSQVCEKNIKGPVINKPMEEDSDSGPDEVKTETKKEDHHVNENFRPKDARKRTHNARRGNQSYQHRKPKLPSTLLQKLLAKEMQQERNIVLQCIRYIRRNNYFDKKE